jgi:hypothetical protein
MVHHNAHQIKHPGHPRNGPDKVEGFADAVHHEQGEVRREQGAVSSVFTAHS